MQDNVDFTEVKAIAESGVKKVKKKHVVRKKTETQCSLVSVVSLSDERRKHILSTVRLLLA